ncbi:MAG: hypothetical protein A3F40_04915 [Chlamydiae bacterium RIFCSPHIGHO2_12_FULL_27_8]|nr:MAG: hypothetical protein A3F40_04915 [Chlamydiae bacterium RIFCSPHIGHO2_12_FULL_27_8]
MKNFLILFLINISIFAAPVGNPLTPEIIQTGFYIPPSGFVNVRLGYEGNFISNANLQKSFNGNEIDNFKLDSNSGSFILNFKKRLDLFGIFGVSRIRSEYRFSYQDVISRIEYESDYRIFYEAGGRVILIQWGNTALDIGGRYSKTKPGLSFIILDGVPQIKDNSFIKFSSYQINLGLSYAIDIFIPYIGTKYSQSKAELQGLNFVISDEGTGYLNMKNKNDFGLYLGCSLSNKRYFLLNLEARFIDEEAISISGEFKF